jgi:hypothetical protein
MPSVLRADGYRLFFYSDERNPREPPHIHAASGERAAKFWLEPVELVKSKRLSASEITALHRLVTRYSDTFLEARHAHFDA